MLLDEAEELLSQRDLHMALAHFNRAQAAGEDADRCRGGRWLAHMLLGNFEQAWLESDAIAAGGVLDPQRFWQGEKLNGKRVILRCLHGLGDAVQFLRYAPQLNRRVAKLIVQVSPPLLELAPHLDGVSNVITWSSHGKPEPAWDVQIEINELPYLFRTELRELPLAVNYLRVQPSTLEAARDSKALRIGLVWSCGAWNPARAVPFSLLQPLLDTPGCEFWNLQGGLARKECPPHAVVHPAEECEGSLLNLSSLIAALDLVITPDTLAAHLAGALGVPAFVLLQYAADWRWLYDRSDSPWYPSLRLFRQRYPGDWPGAVDALQLALTQRINHHWVA